VQVAYTLVAQGHIGQNQLTGVSKVYPLGSVAVPAISGTATFFKRVNGEALAVVQCKNTTNGDSHPGHIHANTAQGGGFVFFQTSNRWYRIKCYKYF
jgi:hypothetical protein